MPKVSGSGGVRPHEAVVVEDPHLVVRERHAEKELVACAGRAAPLRGDSRGGGRAMMPVRDVERVERVQRRGKLRELSRRCDAPYRVLHVVVS